MEFNVEEINKIIRHRRSIYPVSYTGEVVSDEIIQTMLENATWAPSHKLTQPWHFVVFSGKGLNKLATFQSELYKTLSKDNFDEKTYQKLKEKPLECSHVIAIGMKRNELVPEIEEVEAVACAVQNMLLTASAYKLGAYWGSGGITYKEEAKSFFGLESKDKLLGFVFVGVPSIAWPNMAKRKSTEEKVTWIKNE